MVSALCQRGTPSDLLTREGIPAGLADRRFRPSEASWELKASFKIEEVVEVGTMGCGRTKWCGVVGGYIVGLSVAPELNGALRTSFNLNVPHLRGLTDEGCGPAFGVALHVEMAISPNVNHVYDVYRPQLRADVHDALNKRWAEAVCEGSPHFPGGMMEIKATVKLVVKEWGSVSVCGGHAVWTRGGKPRQPNETKKQPMDAGGANR